VHISIASASHNLSDSALLQRWCVGDRFAGNALLSRHFPALSRHLTHKAGADAEDLVQRTLLACTESRHRLRGDSSFRTYMFAVARYELHRLFRQRAQRRQHSESECDDLPGPDRTVIDALLDAERHAAFERALHSLSEPDRLLLEQFYIEGCNSHELASLLSIKSGSVRARLHRARAAVKQELDRHEERGLRSARSAADPLTSSAIDR
jgi:RNA polymerase sigma-70 factor (ECF subfamily)